MFDETRSTSNFRPTSTAVVRLVFVPGCSSEAPWSSTSCIYSRLQQWGSPVEYILYLFQVAAVGLTGRAHPVSIPGCSRGAHWSSTSCIYSRLQQWGSLVDSLVYIGRTKVLTYWICPVLRRLVEERSTEKCDLRGLASGVFLHRCKILLL